MSPAPEVMMGVDMRLAKDLQEGLDLLNKVDPPAIYVPHFLSNPRHECSGARQSAVTGKGVSTAVDAKERYVSGWRVQEDPLQVEALYDPQAEVAIIYREGKCKKCKMLVRSDVGRVVLTAERPPVSGRVARE